MRAIAGGGAVACADAGAGARRPAAAAANWREVVALASGVKPMLHAHLLHDVHPVRIAPGRIEIRPQPSTRRATWRAQLAALLAERTGTRWTVALSATTAGEPTLAEQGRSAETDRRAIAQTHPLVQAILAAFPGATIETVRDDAADDYGLVATPAAAPPNPTMTAATSPRPRRIPPGPTTTTSPTTTEGTAR